MSFNRFFSVSLLALAMIAFVAGCSGSGKNPTMPNSISPDAGITDLDQVLDENAAGARVVWACFDVGMNPDTGEFEIVPLRHSEFTFNVTMFLQPPAGSSSNLGLSVVDASQLKTAGRIDLDISFTHPFPSLTKLRGFDVMGVFMGDGTVTGYNDPSVVYPLSDGTEAILLNADGYTRWMNATEFTQAGLLGFTPGVKGIPGFVPTSTINGYKYYTENLDATTDVAVFYQTTGHENLRGVFEAGSTLTRRFEIQFPMQGGKPYIRFQYAILASWSKPDPASLPDPDIDDYGPTANLQEAFYMAVTTAGTDLYYVDPSDNGGTLKLQIEIFDWQGAANPAGVSGELVHLWIEDALGVVIPGGSYDMLSSVTISAGQDNSSVFTVDIAGCVPQQAGPQEFLITAESASPSDYDNGFGSPYPTGAPLAAFKRFTVDVLNYNPCPTPTVTSFAVSIANVNDIVPGLVWNGTNFVPGPSLAASFRRITGGVVGTNVQVTSPTQAQADFDFSAVSAGMYDFQFINGCGVPAPTVTGVFEVNTPPASTGITGPASGDGNTGIATYNSNAVDLDTDPVDILSYAWTVTAQPSGTRIIGPVPGDPFNLDFATLSVGQFDVDCVVSDGYPPADLNLNYPITRDNTRPLIGVVNGPTPVWLNSTHTYSVVASDIDPGQVLTYNWSLVPAGNPPSYTIPGDPTPGDVTINFGTMAASAGMWDLACQVDDGSGAPNATSASLPFAIYVANPPYTDPVPPAMFNQVIVQGLASLQGIAGCPFFWDSFYAPQGTVPWSHPDISILSGPSLGTPGVMVIADEPGIFFPIGPGTMNWAHFTCPYTSGAAPSWMWLTTGLFPGGPDMIPSVIHFDGNSQGEILTTNSQMTGKLGEIGVPDPAAFQHYIVGGPPLNDLFTSLSMLIPPSPDVAVDTSAGFDMGSPSAPMSADLYGLYTQDMSGILAACGGPAVGPFALTPVNFLRFPSMGAQPPLTPVDMPGSVGVVAPVGGSMVGVGPGLFNFTPGGPSPSGGMVFPEPYYALAIDDDPADNLYGSNLPQPIAQWVIAATIDADSDVEIYEMDFGVAPPGPAPIGPYGTIPMGSFFGGTGFPMDVEFISNFSGFGGTPKPIWNEDLLAVLVVDPVSGVVAVEIYQVIPPAPTLLSTSMPIPTPGAMYAPAGPPGIGYRLDVDEVTGDIYVLHEDTLGFNMAVTIFPS